MAAHTSHYCEVCELSCHSKHNLAQHMKSRRHQARLDRADLMCTICQITTRRRADLETHFKGKKHKNKVLLMGISAATFSNMDDLYQKAVDILGRDTTLPALDLANCMGIASSLKMHQI